MTVVIINASPRAGANCDVLANKVGEAAKANGKDVKVYNLNKLANVKGCQSCFGCKGAGKCLVKDDMTPILEDVAACEALVVAVPVYFGQPCAQYRLFEDRLFSFLDGTMRSTLAPGKKLAVISVAGSAGQDGLAKHLQGVLGNFFGFQPVGEIAFASGNAPDMAANNAELLAKAEELGKKL